MTKAICTVDGCGKFARARGLCSMHDSRLKRHGDVLRTSAGDVGAAPTKLYNATFADRLWSRVDRTGDCWTWTAATDAAGYGRLSVPALGVSLAHRLAWTVTNGPIPEGMEVCHRCDNPPCVRPDHLFLGTHTDNMRDMVIKQRSRRDACRKHGHPFDEKAIVEKNGARRCWYCEQMRWTARNAIISQRRAEARAERMAAADPK